MKLVLLSGAMLLVGVAIGLGLGRYEYSRLGVDKVIAAVRDGESDAELRLRMIEVVQDGDMAKVVRINCLLLKGELQHINPSDFSEARVPEVRAFLTRARAKVAELQAAGNCSFGTPAQQE